MKRAGPIGSFGARRCGLAFAHVIDADPHLTAAVRPDLQNLRGIHAAVFVCEMSSHSGFLPKRLLATQQMSSGLRQRAPTPATLDERALGYAPPSRFFVTAGSRRPLSVSLPEQRTMRRDRSR